MHDLVWSDGKAGLTLYATRKPPPGFAALLSKTEWGTQEVKYQVRGVPRILERIRDPHFLVLEKADNIVGAVVGSRKVVSVGARQHDAFFIAMIAIEPSVMGSGYGSLLATKTREYAHALLRELGIIYLYIESTNTASIRVHRKIGYHEIGQFEARVFARIFPRDDPEVRRPNADERKRLINLLEDQYADHSLLDFRDSVEMGRCFVVTSGGDIVAGAQVRPMHWSLKKLRGFGGFMALKVLPSVPLIRRGYSPEHLRFLRIGNIYFRPGHEAELNRLLQALLARCGVHVGLLFLDRRSAVHSKIQAVVRFGALSGLVIETADVFADFKGLCDEEVRKATAAPINVSPVDPM